MTGRRSSIKIRKRRFDLVFNGQVTDELPGFFFVRDKITAMPGQKQQ